MVYSMHRRMCCHLIKAAQEKEIFLNLHFGNGYLYILFYYVRFENALVWHIIFQDFIKRLMFILIKIREFS